MEVESTLRAAAALSVPAGMMLAGSLTLFVRQKSVWAFLQLLGAGCLVVVVLSHVAEGFDLRWGSQDSAGHYLDFAMAVSGLTLFPLGYLLHAVSLKPR